MSATAIQPAAQHASADSFVSRLRDQGRQLSDTSNEPVATEAEEGGELREAFDSFVGQSFYGMLLKSMRQSLGKTPYFHGGRGEEVFQQQLDQIMVEKMSDASAETFSGPMFELFSMRRS